MPGSLSGNLALQRSSGKKMKSPLCLMVLIITALATPAWAVNPIINAAYSADPSAHVFNGQIYVYGSHDRNDAKEWDMNDYHVYSTDDMQNWQDHGVCLSLKDVPWATGHFWAPDCNYKNGTYYFYFPPRSKYKDRRFGVATSSSPAGPFKNAQPIRGTGGIDPSIFIDDDGTPYLIWAGHGCEICKLNPDMKTLDGKPITIKGTYHFFEGPFVFKRKGIYYLTYPAWYPGGSLKGGSGQNFAYSTAKNIMGPYTYRGIFSNSRGKGNIQGSQLKYHGVWYCFYHDFSSSKGQKHSGFKRGICVDVMHFNPDGTIPPLVWTKDGPKQIKWLNPYSRNEAETICQSAVPESADAVWTQACSEGGVDVCHIHSGAWIRYAGVDFGDGAGGFEARLASEHGGATMTLHLNKMDGPVIATLKIAATGGGQKWQTVHAPVKDATGVHDLYVTFNGAGKGNLADFDWYLFTH